jgi:iron complex outermembrane recepter protein
VHLFGRIARNDNEEKHLGRISIMRTLTFLSSVAVLALATPAWAQDATPQAAPQAEEDAVPDQGEIIVTATRREQQLSDVPLAVSAIGGEALERSGVTDLRALNQLAPSLIVSGATSESNFTARIRGIGTVGENPGLESSVALFIDGVYRSRTGVGLSELGEIERVEVLRGPQGTLFGRNASAGLLNVVTKKPAFDFGAYGAATYGNYDYLRLEGGVTGPIAGETVAAKIEGVYMKRDGFVKQVTPGEPDVNDRDRYLIRGQLLFQPNSDLSIRLIGDYSKRNENCCAGLFLNPVRSLSRINPAGSGAQNVAQGPNTLAPLLTVLGANYQFAPSDQQYVRRTATTPGFPYRADSTDYGFSGELNWDLGGANLTSITAYRNYHYTQGQDADFNALDLLHRTDEDRVFKTFTQELRLQGEAFDGRLDWLVGGYYADEKLFQDQDLKYGADYERFANCLVAAALAPTLVNPASATCSNLPAATFPGYQGFAAGIPGLLAPSNRISNTGVERNTFNQSSRNYAFFTHEIFEIIPDKLTLAAGIRYTNERKQLRSTVNFSNNLCNNILASPFQALSTAVCSINSTAIGLTSASPGTTRKEDEWTGTVNLSFKPIDDLLIYASYSKGYKAGGYNLDTAAFDKTCSTTAGSAAQNAACAALLARPANTPFNGRPEASDLQFDAEKVDAYEVGIKFDGRQVDVNIAAFRQEFDNFQLNTFNGLTFEVTNVAACKDDLGGRDTDGINFNSACAANRLRPGVISQGVEIEYFLYPSRDLTVNGGITYLDSKYRRNLVGLNGASFSNALFQLPGRRTFGSQYALTTAVSWTPALTDSLRGLLYLDMRYSSDVNTGSDLDLEKVQDGYAVVNGRIGVMGGERKWSLEFWGQNLFNKRYQQIAADAPGQGSGTFRAVAAPATTGLGGTANQLFLAFPGEPRTYGVTARFRF